MSLAFIILLPSGVICARHQWVFNERKMWGKALWFQVSVFSLVLPTKRTTFP
jgi:hypothetical protein